MADLDAKYCQFCSGSDRDGHTETCRLAALLQRMDGGSILENPRVT